MSSAPSVSKILTQTMADLESRTDLDAADVERLRQITLRLLIEADAAADNHPEEPLHEAA